MSDAAGHPAGFALNCASVHAFWRVVSLAGRIFGIVRSVFAMFVCPIPAEVTFTVRLAPSALLVFPCVEAVNTGLNGELWQPAAWKRLETAAWTPPIEVTTALTAFGSQLVGLKVKLGRSRVTLTLLIRSGIPWRIVGKGSETSVT